MDGPMEWMGGSMLRPLGGVDKPRHPPTGPPGPTRHQRTPAHAPRAPRPRGVRHNFDPLWRVKARHEGRLHESEKAAKTGQRVRLSRGEALRAWGRIADALAASESADDRHLAHEIRGFVQRQPVVQAVLKQGQREVMPLQQRPSPDIVR